MGQAFLAGEHVLLVGYHEITSRPLVRPDMHSTAKCRGTCLAEGVPQGVGHVRVALVGKTAPGHISEERPSDHDLAMTLKSYAKPPARARSQAPHHLFEETALPGRLGSALL